MLRTEPPLPAARPRLFRGLAAFFECEFRVQFHERMAIVTSVLVQAVILVFVGILAPSLLGIALVGATVFSFFTLGGRVQNEAAFVRVDHRLNQLYLASPLSPESYFLGMSLGVLVAYLPPVAVLAVLSVLVVPLPAVDLAILLGASAAVWVFSVSLGYVISTLFRDMRAIWPYQSIIYNLFGVVPPVFYPLASFPENLRWVALVIPPSAAAGLVQWSIGAVALSSSEVALAAGSLAALAVGMFLFAVSWARRTVREN